MKKRAISLFLLIVMLISLVPAQAIAEEAVAGESAVATDVETTADETNLTVDEPVPDGELGRIVVTDYYNRAFPMIRYDTGDTGKIYRWKDENGRLHAKFTEIYGRRGSMLYNTAGEPLSIHVFMNVLLNFEGVLRQAKCIQTDVDAYELYLNPVNKETLNEQAVLDAYKKYLGADAKVTVI